MTTALQLAFKDANRIPPLQLRKLLKRGFNLSTVTGQNDTVRRLLISPHTNYNMLSQQNEVDQTPLNRAVGELSVEEDMDEMLLKTPERGCVDALLDISESGKELEPYEYHCYSEWEDTFCSWARASPLSCLLTTHTSHRRPKHKDAENLSPVEPTTANEESYSSAAVAQLKSHERPRSSKKSQPLNFQTESWRQTAVADHELHASDCPDLYAMRKNAAHFFSEEKMEEGTLRKTPLQPLFSKYSLSENRRTKPRKQDHNPNRVFIPIKNITLLPSIIPLQLNPKICYDECSGQKAPYVETFENNFSMFDKRSGKKGTSVDTVSNSELTKTAPTSKYQTCQYNRNLFSALSDTFPKWYQAPLSSKLDIVHPVRYPMGKNFSEAMAPNTHPSRLFS